jgi:phosphatidylglycerol---prolipoprotein diacylglyceryl transferase
VTVYPFVLKLGPLAVTGYGLMMMVAFLMGGWAIQLDLRRRGLQDEFAADIVIGAVIGGLVGAKIWYVALTGDLGSLLQRGGFVWYGGLFGGIAGVLVAGWLKRVPARLMFELCAAPLMLGHAIGRIGCFLVQDDYGVPSSVPWAMRFPQGLPPSTVAELTRMGESFPPGTDPMQVVAVHPTQLYETIVMFAAFAWLWNRRTHEHGTGWLFGWYLVLAGAERFLVEFLRIKDDRLIGDFTVAQVTSLLLVVAGIYLLRIWGEKDAISLQPSALRIKTEGTQRSTGVPADR